ncbi:MAG: nicotinate-nucleotide pyrophosphorylase (carboxylating) [Candidatus Omnitrophota bacterium]|jgi:nicotinate-nucleotide pyrophosphorylase (carboxylating)
MKQTDIKKVINAALKEDKARNDITSNTLISPSHKSTACIIAKQDAIICGIKIAREAFIALDKSAKVKSLVKDGDQVKKGDVLLSIKGNTRALLASERIALNFLGYLSGIATNTNDYVQAIKPLKTKILDTRKTTPTLRVFEKYAVACGGGTNHRQDLSTMVFIKDNHREIYENNITLCDAVKKFRQKTRKLIEVEVDTLSEFEDVLEGNPDYILLDNMTLGQMSKAVQTVKKIKAKRKPQLEASGGITLKRVKAIAKTGVDRISIGALTHTHKSVNVSMEILT